MKTVVFGGTGAVGRLVVEKLQGQGKNVLVLTRNSQLNQKNTDYVLGNVLNMADVEKCIEQGDEIIVCLGFNNSDTDTMSRGTRNVILAMKEKHATRLLCLSAQGAGDSWEYMPEDFKLMVANDPVLTASFTDHHLQEKYVSESGLEWTIVRPSEIIESETTGSYSIGYPADDARFQISSHDVADFIADEIHQKKYLFQAVLITN